jgi:hypothetical protein
VLSRGAGSAAEPRGAESAPLAVGACAERRVARCQCRGTRAAVHAARRVPIGYCHSGLERPFMEQTIVQHTQGKARQASETHADVSAAAAPD